MNRNEASVSLKNTGSDGESFAEIITKTKST